MKSTFFRKYLLLSLFLWPILTSCGYDRQQEMGDYVQTVKTGIKVLPWPKEMEALFGEGDNFITEYNLASGPRLWNTEVFFGGRYTLDMQVEVTINYKSHKVLGPESSPKFYLHEVKSVDRTKGETTLSKQWNLDQEQWQKLVKAKGDWSVLGIHVRTNDPVPGFDDYISGLRAPRVRFPRH